MQDRLNPQVRQRSINKQDRLPLSTTRRGQSPSGSSYSGSNKAIALIVSAMHNTLDDENAPRGQFLYILPPYAAASDREMTLKTG